MLKSLLNGLKSKRGAIAPLVLINKQIGFKFYKLLSTHHRIEFELLVNTTW